MTGSKVAVGVSTLAGYSTSVVTLAGALAAYVGGDRSQDTLIIILLGGYSALSLLVTQVGRYVQAHALAKKAPVSTGVVYAGSGMATGSTGSRVTFSGNTISGPEDAPDPDPPSGPDPQAANPELDRVTS